MTTTRPVRTTHAAVAALSATLLAAALAGCGSSSPSSSSGPSTSTAPAGIDEGGPDQSVTASPTPANPVNLIKAAGATPDPGTTSGRYDINGNRYAEGFFPTPAGAVPTGGGTSGPEKISVRTYTNNADRDAADASLRTTSDSQTAIRVDLAWVTVDAVDLFSGGYLYYVSPTVIAARVHGVVVPVAP